MIIGCATVGEYIVISMRESKKKVHIKQFVLKKCFFCV